MLEFIECIKWPFFIFALLLIMFLFLKNSIKQKISSVKRMKGKGLILDFFEKFSPPVKALGSDVSAAHNDDLDELSSSIQERRSDFQIIREMAFFSPRAALIESWHRIEHELYELAKTLEIDIPERQTKDGIELPNTILAELLSDIFVNIGFYDKNIDHLFSRFTRDIGEFVFDYSWDLAPISTRRKLRDIVDGMKEFSEIVAYINDVYSEKD